MPRVTFGFPDPFDASIPPPGPSIPYVAVIVGTDNHTIPQFFHTFIYFIYLKWKRMTILGARGKTDRVVLQIFNYRYEHIA